jgi:4-nitrophenyl phosphatase
MQALSRGNTADLLKGLDAVLFDLDGVLLAGEHVFPGVPQLLSFLRSQPASSSPGSRKVKTFFITNNATKSRRQLQEKFRRNGIDANYNEVMCSAFAAATYLGRRIENPPAGTPRFTQNVYVVGEPGLHEELKLVLKDGQRTYGLEHNGVAYNPVETAALINDAEKNKKFKELNIGAVVSGLDFHMNMTKLAVAALCLADPKCLFIATNKDEQLPIHGAMLPGNGSLVRALETASGRLPDAVCGKPDPLLLRLLCEREGLDPSRCLMVGDRLSTDVAFGQSCGCKTLLVFSGCEGLDDVKRTGIQPDFYANSAVDLMTFCQAPASNL